MNCCGSILAAVFALAAQSVVAQDDASEKPITFNRDIAPIIFAHCGGCHRPDGAGPFSLLDYASVKARARQVAAVTASRFMPPWLPEHTSTRGGFLGERRLSDQEIQAIQQWVRDGAPEGDAHDLPPKPVPPGSSPQANGWSLGKPDLILTMDGPFTVPAEGNDILHSFVLPVNVLGDRFVKAVEFRPSNPRVVHHASFLVDETGGAAMMDKADPALGYPGMGDIGFNRAGSFGGWTPGQPIHMLPPGTARRLPDVCDFVVEIHFNPTGKPEIEQSSIGLYFAREPIESVATAITLGSLCIDIPPGEQAYQASDRFELPVAMKLLGIAPHAHYVCQKMSINAALPDGTVLPLLRIDDWDFNWQQQYFYRQPVSLPAGTMLTMRNVYDNSAANPQNPHDPPVRVKQGHLTEDEMALHFLHVTAENPADLPRLEEAHRKRQLERIDEARRFRESQRK